ncbi:archaeosortase/exosortase family protein [Reinekea marina]|uniref:Archaeosortase/exosortase family protein n=1 Tax=Reinekea marina TaxID=1310421 RepID=A0ABV7WU36_9GAMM|nr:archaeosortase/exosortase family protein [Reinekea marina]MDN3648149.1 archaeosortase/exosortase family protein [Reinekea marina]
MKPQIRPSMAILLYLLAIIVIAFSFFFNTLLSLHTKWTQWDEAYSHGYPLFLIALYYCCAQLVSAKQQWRGHLAYSLVSIIPAVIWAYGEATQLQVLQQIALPMAIFTLALPLVGMKIGLRIIPVFLLMSLAIPVWDVVNPILRALTTEAATFLVRLVGITAYIDGFSFTLPYGTVVIAGGCSGLAFFMMALSLSGINAFYRRLTLKYAVLSIALLVTLSVVGNWLRVTALIMIAYYSKMQHSLVYEHGSFGWWIFAGIFFLYLWLIRNYAEQPAKAASAQEVSHLKNARPVWALTLAVVFMAALPIYMVVQSAKATQAQPTNSMTNNYDDQIWLPNYSGFDAQAHTSLMLANTQWQASQLLYTTQEQGKELVSSDNRMATENAKLIHDVITAEGNKLNLDVIQTGNRSRIVVWAYKLGSQLKTSAFSAKHAQFIEVLRGNPSAELVYLTKTCQQARCEAEKQMLQANLAQWVTVF